MPSCSPCWMFQCMEELQPLNLFDPMLVKLFGLLYKLASLISPPLTNCFRLCALQGEAQDFLFIAIERYKFCVLQWDPETSELVTRSNSF